MRSKWMAKWMSWTLVHEMSRWTLVYEMNEMKVTRQICNTPLLKYIKNEKQFYILFFFSFFFSSFCVLQSYQITFLQYVALSNKSSHNSLTDCFGLLIIRPEVNNSYHISSVYRFGFLTIRSDFALKTSLNVDFSF